MSTINTKAFSNPKNINLVQGLLRFGATQAQNFFDASSYGLYVNASGELVFSSAGSSTILGAAGGGAGVPTWEQLIQNDQTLQIGGLASLTIDRNTGNLDVLTLTNSGAGSGDVLQITNVGTGKDINGTSGTWSFSKAGAGVALTMTLAGTADANSLVLTQGDVSIADGKVAIVNADNETTVAITNDGLTSATALALAGSGTFTGSTTTSFVTITPSGLTTGTAMYLVTAGLTEGKAIHVVANAVTSGVVVHIASSVATTVLTGAGRLFKVDHTGNATGTGIIAEVNSAAADETVIFKVTGSAALALGKALQVSVAALTTGNAIDVSDADSLTTGKALYIASSATAITTSGRLLHVNHTGVTSTSGTLVEFASAAADETIVVGITANDLATGKMLDFGTNIALTTGQLFSMLHTTSVIADGGSMIRLSSTGINTGGATNGTMLDIQTTSQVAGTQVLVKAGAVTTGVVLSLISTTGLTSGSVIRATTSTAGAVATNGAFSFTGTGDFTVGAVGLGLFHIGGNSTTAGTVASVSGTALTTGVAVHIASTGTGMTSGSLLRATTGTTGAVATNGIISLRATGAYTSTANAGLLDVRADSTTGGTVVRFSGNGITDGTILHLSAVEATLTTGLYINCYDGAASDFSVGKYGATVIAGNAIGTAALTLTNGDATLTSGNLILTAGHIKNTPQAIVNANTAISIVTLGTTIANNAGSTHTLADGTVGQLKYIVCTVYTADAVITPANFVGTTITLNAAGDSWLGVFVGSEWVTLALGGTAAVA